MFYVHSPFMKFRFPHSLGRRVVVRQWWWGGEVTTRRSHLRQSDLPTRTLQIEPAALKKFQFLRDAN